MSTVTEKIVTFTVGGPDESSKWSQKLQLPADDSHQPLAQEIGTLANALRAVEDEQGYMAGREAAHRNSEYWVEGLRDWGSGRLVLVVGSGGARLDPVVYCRGERRKSKGTGMGHCHLVVHRSEEKRERCSNDHTLNVY